MGFSCFFSNFFSNTPLVGRWGKICANAKCSDQKSLRKCVGEFYQPYLYPYPYPDIRSGIIWWRALYYSQYQSKGKTICLESRVRGKSNWGRVTVNVLNWLILLLSQFVYKKCNLFHFQNQISPSSFFQPSPFLQILRSFQWRKRNKNESSSTIMHDWLLCENRHRGEATSNLVYR